MTEAPPVAAAPPKPANPLVGPVILLIWLALGGVLVAAPSGPLVFAFVMVGWILSVMAHEFSHAAVAWLGGDRTVTEKGYLSFDPRRYGDLGVSLVIPLLALLMGGIGFPGGAVYIRNDLIRGPLWRSAASLAGPAATFVVLLALSFGLAFWAGWGVHGAGPLALFEALSVLAFLQAMGLILNLLPIPGLDGFGVIRPFLPTGLAFRSRRAEGVVMLILLLALFVVPGVSSTLFQIAARLGLFLGLDLDALQAGWRAFHFWQR
ncbi:site-2 protease family protein [Phenylobacterium sp.]|uniref:site-2 protease family protein n=1 Tax=Phenylobacterium sp. TaxID=1871053 RepID=UPI0012067ABA|nr:site-2 protease family protein [Phenylobacterium sp.]THD58616.1 MAG: site-2 protease family protein [Phenylobacterium sp.]